MTKTIQYRLRQDLKQMMSFYKDLFDGSVSCANEAFTLMKESGFLDENGEEIDEDD